MNFYIKKYWFVIFMVSCYLGICFVVFADTPDKKDQSSLNQQESFISTVRVNIFPVYENQAWKLVDYNGKEISKQKYSSVYVNFYEDKYHLYVSRNDQFFIVNETGTETKLLLPSGFDIVESTKCPKYFLILKDKKKSNELSPYRVYDLRCNKFVTDYLGMVTCDENIICGVKPESKSREQTEFVVYKIENGKSDIIEKSNEFSRGAVIGNLIIAERKGQNYRGRGELFDLNLNKVLSPQKNYAFGWIHVNEGKVMVVFREENKDPVFGFIDYVSGTVIAKGYKNASEYNEGMAKVQSNDSLFGFINEQGHLSIPCQFSLATKFSQNVSFVYNSKNSKIFAIDKSGKCIFDLPFLFSQTLGFESLIYGVVLYNENMRQTYPAPSNSSSVNIHLKNVEGKSIWKGTSQKDVESMRRCLLYAL
ncbi:MAG: WG repeat-containing protein [Planctomycetaceae bacterium]|jgi:hypothetical protein|nr:WG repeat-containing protein [Planctomycetaceae bacterium]